MARVTDETARTGARRALHQAALFGSVFALLGATFGGCASILGIEDRPLGGAGGQGGDGGGGPSPACDKYCETVMANCSGTLQQYADEATCLATCATFESGESSEPEGNTLACRNNNAVQAGVGTNAGEFCPVAGPAGGGKCGSDCDAYCSQLAVACPDEFGAIFDCPAMCLGLEDGGLYTQPAHHNGNTIDCRIYHTGAALANPAGAHCGHAAFVPLSQCLDTDSTEIDCSVYCQNAMIACTGELAVYESPAQCERTCSKFSTFAVGTEDSLDDGQPAPNTVACRQYHSGAAITDPGEHCDHVSPSGGGVCGGADSPCDSYCLLLGQTCPIEFANVIGAGSGTTDQERCLDACHTFLPDASSEYAIPAIQPDTIQCYTLAITRALESGAGDPVGFDANCARADLTLPCDPAVGAP